MENHLDFHGYDHPNNHDQPESASVFGCLNSDEDFHHGLASLNGDHSQPTPAFEPGDGSVSLQILPVPNRARLSAMEEHIRNPAGIHKMGLLHVHYPLIGT